MENIGSQHAHLFSFAGVNKAGMQDADKELQQRVIYEASKNSNYFKHAEIQDKKVDVENTPTTILTQIGPISVLPKLARGETLGYTKRHAPKAKKE